MVACGVKSVKNIERVSKGLKTAEKTLALESASQFAGSKRAPLDYAPYQKIRNKSAVINGRKYTGHALDRMQDRGFMPSVIENTISEGQTLPGSFAGTLEYYDAVNKVKVVVGESGQVITIIPGRG